MKPTIRSWGAVIAIVVVIGASRAWCETKEGAATDPKVTAAIKVVEDPNTDVLLKFKACEELEKLGPKAAPAVPALIEMMKANPDTQSAAATVFGAIGPEAKQAVSALIDATRSNNATTRGCAAGALSAIGPDASSAAPAVIKLLDDPDVFARNMALGTLHRIGLSPQDKEAALKKLALVEANDPDQTVREGAKLEINLLKSNTTFGVLHGERNAPEAPAPIPAAANAEGNPLDPTASTAAETNPLDSGNPLDTGTPVDPWVGTFTGEKLAIEITASREHPGQYAGFIRIGAQEYPLRAKAVADKPGELSGTFTSGTGAASREFAFMLSLAADQQTLTLSTGKTRYTLSRSKQSI
jgi:hypothetical protein